MPQKPVSSTTAVRSATTGGDDTVYRLVASAFEGIQPPTGGISPHDPQRYFYLDYLREYPLGSAPSVQRRNVRLQVSRIKDLRDRLHYFQANSFAWKHARRLEGRGDTEDSAGIWPINCWRCERRLGNPGADLFDRDMTLADAASEVYTAAFQNRTLCYHRVIDSLDARRLLNAQQEVRYATEITSDWYDPPGGVIRVTDREPVIVGSHAVPIALAHRLGDDDCFLFRNSWGQEWGSNGCGAIGADYYDRFIIESWSGVGSGLNVPIVNTKDIVCLEWKWSANDEIGIHCREIVDAHSTERLAWAICKSRNGFLDVEEFFVWPTERRKGYGRILARMLRDLAKTIGLPLRLLVSYADTEPANEDNLAVTARLLEVEIVDCDLRWVHRLGTAAPHLTTRPFSRPQRPAFLLEMLRPRDERPIETPIEYSVLFGTNRKPGPAAVQYGVERDTTLHSGIGKITIPRTHQFGSKGRFWVRAWNYLTGQQPRLLQTRLFSDEAEFQTETSIVQSCFGDEAHNLLYVHGFNVTFEGALTQAARFGVDLKIPGTTFCFSWPSLGRFTGYTADEASVEASLPAFEEFIRRILRSTGNAPLSIVVHSMGNRAVLRILESIARDNAAAMNSRIQNVILAAPDVDTEVFKQAVPHCLTVATRTTLYTTRADLALLTSGWLHKYPRAGLAPPVVVLPGMDTVLVEGFNLLDLGHDYYAAAASVLHDMFSLIHYGAGPHSRPAVTLTQSASGENYWKLAN